VLNAVSAAIAPEETDVHSARAAPSVTGSVQATDELTEQTGTTTPPGPDWTGESVGLKRVPPERGETATDRLRASHLLDTAASALGLRSQRTKLPDGMPMFLQPDRENVMEQRDAGTRISAARRRS
jgi:hypothetical protein